MNNSERDALTLVKLDTVEVLVQKLTEIQDNINSLDSETQHKWSTIISNLVDNLKNTQKTKESLDEITQLLTQLNSMLGVFAKQKDLQDKEERVLDFLLKELGVP